MYAYQTIPYMHLSNRPKYLSAFLQDKHYVLKSIRKQVAKRMMKMVRIKIQCEIVAKKITLLSQICAFFLSQIGAWLSNS